MKDIAELGPGEIGVFTASIKQVRDTRVGDTITHEKRPCETMLPGYKPAQPVVFCGLFPVDSAEFEDLRDAIEKLALNDASFSFEMETSAALGFGFRCGFLGLLHMEIIQERLRREFDMDVISTYPSVIYKVTKSDGTEVEIEEAFVDTLALPAGTGLRFGRFYSDIGYLNRVHSHAWDFRDQPLVYRAMLNNQYTDDGVRFSWVAPTDLYFLLGGETFRGSRFPGGDATDTLGNIQTLFAKLGGDVGSSHSWQAGLSQMWVNDVDRSSSGHVHGDPDEGTGDSFTGDSNLTIADLVWKWAPNGERQSWIP